MSDMHLRHEGIIWFVNRLYEMMEQMELLLISADSQIPHSKNLIS